MKKIIMLLVIISIAIAIFSISSYAKGWYNDTPENDSCLVIESDFSIYPPGTVKPILKFENSCGQSLNANVGFFFDKGNIARVSDISNIRIATSYNVNWIKTNESCAGEIAFVEQTSGYNAYRISCTLDSNSDVFLKDVNSYNLGNDSFKIARPSGSYNWIHMNKNKTANVLNELEERFDYKDGFQNVVIPQGTYFVELTFNAPIILGEFMISAYDTANPNFKSVLDPTVGSLLEDFEDMSDWSAITGGGTSTIQDVVAIDGNALQIESDGQNDNAQEGFSRLFSGKTFGAYVRSTDLTNRADFIFQGDADFITGLQMVSGGGRVISGDGNPMFATFDENTWYFILFEGPDQNAELDNSHFNVFQYGTDLVLMESFMNRLTESDNWEPSNTVFVVNRDSGAAQMSSFYDQLFSGLPPSVTVDQNISDLNAFEFDDFSGDINLDIDTETKIVWDFNSNFSDQNSDSIEIYYNLSQQGHDDNCFIAVRDSYVCGWNNEKIDGLTWSLIEGAGDLNHWRSSPKGSHVFRNSAFNLNPIEFETKDSSFLFNSGNNWIKALLTNVENPNQSTDSNILINYSISADFTGTVDRHLVLFDCNSDVLDPFENENCIDFVISPDDPIEKDEYRSVNTVTNDVNQLVADNNVTINADGNHYLYLNCPFCNPSQFWDLNVVNQNSNVDVTRNFTSTTGLLGLAAFSNTLDLHMHWLDLSNVGAQFNWIIQMSNNSAVDFNSEMQTSTIVPTNLAPIVNDITSPDLPSFNKGDIDFNATVSDPNGDDLNCNIFLYNEFGTAVQTFLNISVAENTCDTTYDSTIRSDGNYFISVTVFETSTPDNFSSDLNQDLNWMADNTAPVTTHDYDFAPQPSPIQIIFTCTDSNSGCSSSSYRVDSGDWTTTTDNPFSATIFGDPDTNSQVDFNSSDNATNVETTNSIQIRFTVSPPSPFNNPQRFFAIDDPRIKDTNRFFAIDDQRGQKISVESDRFIMQNIDPAGQTIELNLTTGVIIVILIVIGLIIFRRIRK